MNKDRQVHLISVSHERADLEDMEKAKELLGGEGAPPGVLDYFTLETCNRWELYFVTHKNYEPDFQDEIEQIGFYKALYLKDVDVARHMMRVASGLDSAVLGDDQILGQFKKQYRGADVKDDLLNDYYEKAVHTAQKIKEETALNEGTVRISVEAVNQAGEHLNIENANVAIVGAGQTGENVFKAVSHRTNGEVYLVNRTKSLAQQVIEESRYKAEAFGLDELDQVIWNSNLVISATSSEQPVITDEDVVESFDGLFIDLANPRDIEISEEYDVLDLDDINEEVRQSRADREEESRPASKIVEEEMMQFTQQLKEKEASECIKDLYEFAEEEKQDNVERALAQIEEGDQDLEQVFNSFADSLTNTLLERPVDSMREAARKDDREKLENLADAFDVKKGNL